MDIIQEYEEVAPFVASDDSSSESTGTNSNKSVVARWMFVVCFAVAYAAAVFMVLDTQVTKPSTRSVSLRSHHASSEPSSIPFFNYTGECALSRHDSRGRRNELSIFVQHIPKSGGSSLWGNYLTKYKDELCPDCQFVNHYVSRLSQRPFTKVFDADMSETEFDPTVLTKDVATFTMIRNPEHHVLSQFFHCTESKWARKSRNMPDLDGWLDFWIEAREQGTADQYNDTHAPFLYEPFWCYRPVNMLTQFTNGMTSAEELQQNYFAIGITDQMVKSSCVIGTRLFGQVPSGCDCSHDAIVHNTTRQDHNVNHHGDSFQLSDSQREKISSLTDTDQVLYRNAQLVFEQEVGQLEEAFGVRFCDK